MGRIRMDKQACLIGCLGFLFLSLIGEEIYASEANTVVMKGNGCRTPSIGPFDPVVKKYFKKLDPLICNADNRPPLVDSNNTAIYINPEAIPYYYNDLNDVDCCWRAIHRVEYNDNDITYNMECHEFVNSATITNSEYVKVECSLYNAVIYKDVFMFLPRSSWLENKYRKLQAINGKNDRLSVLILAVESVSRNHMYRSMPRTVQVLTSLHAAELTGYMKVGENTFPNLVPALTGLSVSELEKVCWPSKSDTFDDCPFIWKNFSSSGYRTIYAGDACWIMAFNYMKRGFREPPTDYYSRPFCIASENEIGHTRPLNVIQCLGQRKSFDHLLSYTKKAAREFVDDPYFALIWQNSITHDIWSEAQWADDGYADVISELFNERLLESTVLIVMSDHGSRRGDFRRTYQGRMEDSRPFMFVVAPYWWRKKHRLAWSNLRHNKKHLVTAYDLHETLKDLLHNENLLDSRLTARTRAMPTGDHLPRAISLFQPIPDYRTCAMAGIPDRWCVCHNIYEIPVDNYDVRERAVFFVSKLNEMLEKYPQCAELKLKEVKRAVTLRNVYDGKTVYTLTIKTHPGSAIFEATVDYERNVTNNEFVGAISRLNTYKERSAFCMDDYDMKPYCHCL